jgi:hypothetical protein
MNVMSDLGVVVTGVVIGSASGIGGALLGAWMNGRSQMAGLRVQLAAEDANAHRADKRQIYGRVLADATELIRTNYFDTDNHVALVRVASSVNELRIVAPPDVVRLANRYVSAAADTRPDSPDTGQLGLRRQFLRAMRADLGYQQGPESDSPDPDSEQAPQAAL